MNNLLKLIALSATAVALTGCATQTFEISGGEGGRTETGTSQFFVSGLGQEDVIDAAAICGGASKVVSVTAELSPIDGVLGSLTSGIYTPRSYTVVCKN